MIHENQGDQNLCIASLHASEFDIDPLPFAKLLIIENNNSMYVTYEQLASIAEEKTVVLMKSPCADQA